MKNFGVTKINSRRRLDKYELFILVSQADQVCYLPFSRLKSVNHSWISVMQINSRSRVDGPTDNKPLQQPSASIPNQSQASFSKVPLVNVDDLINKSTRN